MIKKTFNRALAFVAGDIQQPKSLNGTINTTSGNTCWEGCPSTVCL